MISNAEAHQILDGVMLSDGTLVFTHNKGEAYLSVPQAGTSHLDWLTVIADALEALGVGVTAKGRGSVHQRKDGKLVSMLTSRCSRLLTLEHQRWYRGEKIVPYDLVLTPVSLAHWFMGDGTTSRYKPRPWPVYLKLSTQGFDPPSIHRLIRCLADVGLGGFKVYWDRHCSGDKGFFLKTGNSTLVDRFLKTVAPFVVHSFDYKIKYPGSIYDK